MTATMPGEPGQSLDVLWSLVQTELQFQTTKPIYNVIIRPSKLVSIENHEARIAIPASMAWNNVQGRLSDSILRTLKALAKPSYDVESAHFITDEDDLLLEASSEIRSKPEICEEPPPPENVPPPKNLSPPENLPPQLDCQFAGFKPITSNFTMAPDQYFDEVIPRADGSVTKLVGAVIRNTLGTFIDKRHHKRRETWYVNAGVAMARAGIKSRPTLYLALWDARSAGYIVAYKPVGDEKARAEEEAGYQVTLALRLRFDDESVDYPEEKRPEYHVG